MKRDVKGEFKMNPLRFLAALGAAIAGWIALMWFALLAVSAPEFQHRLSEPAAAPAADAQPAPSATTAGPVGVRFDAPPKPAAGAAAAPAAQMAELERRYLDCNRAAMTRLLGFGEASQCSVIYERLLAERFGGDFERLLQWSRSTPQRRVDGSL